MLPMACATMVLIKDSTFVPPSEVLMDVATGMVRHSRSIEAERFLKLFADFHEVLANG